MTKKRETWAQFEVWRQRVEKQAEELGIPAFLTPLWRARYAK